MNIGQLDRFSGLGDLLVNHIVHAADNIDRQQVLQNNSRAQVDIVTGASHGVSGGVLEVYLLHLADDLENER